MSKLNSFYSENELVEIGFKKFGKNVFISRKASFYNPEEIVIGNNVRIDDFCILSGNISIGNYIHISAFTGIYGKFGVVLKDYAGLSPRTTIFSAIDDFSGEYLIGPLVDAEKSNVTGGPVIISRFVQIGAGSIVFPNLTINEGSVVGAMSLVKTNLDEWGIFAGIPVNRIKNRNKDLLKYLND